MGIRHTAEGPDLTDARGIIPAFPPRPIDASRRPIPISPEEREARRDAALRTLDALDDIPDVDLRGLMEEGMRAIDAARPPGRKLFDKIPDNDAQLWETIK